MLVLRAGRWPRHATRVVLCGGRCPRHGTGSVIRGERRRIGSRVTCPASR
ncbi:hypothetical protein YT1_2504 [Rhodococcus ruber]|nr:hypothetical protein YT1_2504 [Rhodococcus ruber]